jgi:CelD/BcsL family acetyltransferase involved in cellulose biosynthesis
VTPIDGVERVTRLERLRELEPLLDDLFRRDPQATPFQSPAWLLPWIECFAEPTRLECLLVYAGGRLVAALPLLICEQDGERSLRWIGQGISDRLDALVDPGAPALALERARHSLAELASEVDRVELDELPSAEPAHDLWRALPGTRLEPSAVCPVLQLSCGLAELEQTLPAWLRRNLGQTERRLAALGHPEWRRAGGRDGAAALEAFMDLHTARWRARGGEGVLADPAVRAFHRAAAPRLLARGLLALDVLYLDERAVAASYVLERSDAHLYLFGFDPALPRLSLGSLAIWKSIRSACAAGLARYDFLRGSEPYKYAFGATDRRSYRCVGMSAPEREKAAGGVFAQPFGFRRWRSR